MTEHIRTQAECETKMPNLYKIAPEKQKEVTTTQEKHKRHKHLDPVGVAPVEHVQAEAALQLPASFHGRKLRGDFSDLANCYPHTFFCPTGHTGHEVRPKGQLFGKLATSECFVFFPLRVVHQRPTLPRCSGRMLQRWQTLGCSHMCVSESLKGLKPLQVTLASHRVEQLAG